MRITLTDLAIQNLKPTVRQTRYFCNRTPNFGVLVGKRTKSFFIITGRERRPVHLGKYPSISLSDARKRASKLIDAPNHTPTTVQEAIELYLQTYIRPNYRPRSAYHVERQLKRLPVTQVRQLSSKDFTNILDTLPPSEANHFFGISRTFLKWCERRDLIPQSPISKLTKPHKEKSRDRVLTPEEIKKVWTASGDDTFGCIIKLCLITGQRRGEVSAIKAQWIQNDILNIPKEITKNKREHTIPLIKIASALVASLLSSTSPKNSPHATEKSFKTWSKPKTALDQKSGVSNWTIHDLRRTFSTNLAELQVPPNVIDRLLNHSTGSLHHRYNRYAYMTEMREALELWEKKLYTIVA